MTWRLIVGESREVITDADGLFDVPTVRETANPFANFGVAKLDDTDGEQYNKFPRGTKVDFDVSEDTTTLNRLVVSSGDTFAINNTETEQFFEVQQNGDVLVGGDLVVGDSFSTKLQGFVVERKEIEDSGSDKLEIEVYSLDQLLRGDKVSQSTKNKSVATVLENIIVNDTPVDWNASLVEIENNINITREYRGERVDTTILQLAFRSANEEPRVTEDIEFEFKRRELTQSPRDIDQNQYFFVDQPEEGREVVNECRVWYNNGNDKVTVENGADKLALQDSLGLNDPYSTVKEASRPEITELDDAKAVGNKILDDREPATPLKVTTFGLETAESGDVINVQIPEKGIDDDFQIASIEYNWAADETELILIEQTGQNDDLLVRVVDAVERVELEGTDRDADDARITDSRVVAEFNVTVDIGGDTFTNTRFVNLARNKVRDAWDESPPINITDIAIGDDGTGLSRANTDLQNETNRKTPSENLPSPDTVEYAADFSNVTVDEVGLFDGNGDMIVRAVGDTVSIGSTSQTITVSIQITDNPDVDRGVLTKDGQEAVRDIIADNSPNLPDKYAYGSDGTMPTESDTSLGNQQITVGLKDIPVQSANTTTEWNNII